MDDDDHVMEPVSLGSIGRSNIRFSTRVEDKELTIAEVG